VLRGRFGDTTGRPYLEARLFIPRLNLDADISFLVDTGADSSLLGPADAYEMNVDYSKLRGRSESLGTAGVAYSYTEPASVALTDPGRFVYLFHVKLDIAAPSPHTMELPSLLGREILDRMLMTYDPTNRVLRFKVRSADRTIPLR
jgi:hypothetical protein